MPRDEARAEARQWLLKRKAQKKMMWDDVDG